MATYGIDFDRTWTSDPELWRTFVDTAVRRGHRVLLVTNRVSRGRYGSEVKRALLGVPVLDIVFAGAAPKRYAAALRGHRVDVWIDDQPGTVDQGLTGAVRRAFWREPGVGLPPR